MVPLSFKPGAFDFGALGRDVNGMNAGSMNSSYDPSTMGILPGDQPMIPGMPGEINIPGAGIPGLGGGGAGSGLGWNLGTANLALNGLGTIAGIFGGLKSLSLANKQFKLQKEFGNINLNNQIKSYNTALMDRSRSRAKVEGQDPSVAAAYVSSNSLSRDTSRKNVGG